MRSSVWVNSGPSSSEGGAVYTNYVLVSALLAFALAQSIKVFTTWYKEHRWDLKQLIGSGGMPSSHSATVTALAVAVALQDGLGGSTFATALVLACIVMYDATGVRLQAGRQAEVLNQIVYGLPAEHPLAESSPLRELLGHTPPQVIAGGLLGMMTSTIIYLISHSAIHLFCVIDSFMRSIEDKACVNLGSPAANQIHKPHRTALAAKPTPSKWDDAQKWLVNLSRGIDKTHSNTDPRDSNADDRSLITPLPNPTTSTSEIDEGLVIKKVDFGASLCSVRDMGTEMTPMASQEPSRSATPVRSTTPAASASSTPARPTVVAPRADATRFGQESNGTEDVIEIQNRNGKLNPLETRALAWDEAERAKYMARFKREEVKIEAWENHEKRKAEMEMKRMEAKAERLKARAQEKYTNKVASTRRIAEEKRAKAEAILNEKAVQTCERADYIRRTGHLPSSFSIKLPWCCW